MGHWRDRYAQGEHVAVWQEMISAGGVVREAAVFEDAVWVARETMRRVRDALEAGKIAFEPAGPKDSETLDQFESTSGPLPLSVRAFYEVIASAPGLGIASFLDQVDRLLAARRGEQELYLMRSPRGAPITVPLPDHGADCVLVEDGADMVVEGEPLFFVAYLREAVVAAEI